MVPQAAPSAAQVVGSQHLLFALHTSPLGHAPQLMLCPVQLSEMTPQLSAEHTGGVHVVHCPVVLWQVSPLGHVPQSMTFPQPSPVVPHSRPLSAQLFGAQH
jgi:hypothetical protein